MSYLAKTVRESLAGVFSRRSTAPAASLVLLIALFVTKASPAFAATALSWGECVRLASENNPDIRAAKESLNAADSQRKAAYAPFLPQVAANAGYTHGNSTSQAGATLPASREVDVDTYSATLSATQNLFNGFADRSKLDQARATERASLANIAIVKAKVNVELKTAFANLAFASRSVTVSEEIIKRREHNLDLVQLRYESGRENKGSVLLSKAYLGQARLELRQAQNAVITSQAQLAKVTGSDASAELLVTGEIPPPEIPTGLSTKGDIRHLVEEVPEHRQAVAQEEASAAAVGVARGGLLPSLNLTASVGKQDTAWFPRNDRWSAGLTLSIPLFSGGKDFFGTQVAEATRSSVRASRESTDQQLLVKIRQAYAGYLEAIEREKSDRGFYEAAELRSEVARNKYNNGLLSFEDWDVIENDLITREKAVLQSQRDRVIAEANLEQSLGRGAIQ